MARIGFIQSLPEFGAPDRNRERLDAQLQRIQADLVVLPELCHSGYVFRSASEVESLAETIPGGPTSRFLADHARQRRMTIVAGICERGGNRFYNSAAVFTPDGTHAGTYRKVHLFKDEKLWFTPGDQPFTVIETSGLRIGVLVCFDWRFPEATRVLALAGAEVIAHPSNLVLPYCQEVMRARCIENRIFAVTANRVGADLRPDGAREVFTGRSQVVDPEGEVLVRADSEGEAEAAVDIDPAAARRKQINAQNDLFADRRPEFYAALVDAPAVRE
jgi:predicted amidohydrolase